MCLVFFSRHAHLKGFEECRTGECPPAYGTLSPPERRDRSRDGDSEPASAERRPPGQDDVIASHQTVRETDKRCKQETGTNEL